MQSPAPTTTGNLPKVWARALCMLRTCLEIWGEDMVTSRPETMAENTANAYAAWEVWMGQEEEFFDSEEAAWEEEVPEVQRVCQWLDASGLPHTVAPQWQEVDIRTWRHIEANGSFTWFGVLSLLLVGTRGTATVAGTMEEEDKARLPEEEGSTEERDKAGTPEEEDEDTWSAEPGPSWLFLHSVTLRQRSAAGDATEDTDARPIPKRRCVRAFALRGEHAGSVEVETTPPPPKANKRTRKARKAAEVKATAGFPVPSGDKCARCVDAQTPCLFTTQLRVCTQCRSLQSRCDLPPHASKWARKVAELSRGSTAVPTMDLGEGSELRPRMTARAHPAVSRTLAPRQVSAARSPIVALNTGLARGGAILINWSNSATLASSGPFDAVDYDVAMALFTATRDSALAMTAQASCLRGEIWALQAQYAGLCSCEHQVYAEMSALEQNLRQQGPGSDSEDGEGLGNAGRGLVGKGKARAELEGGEEYGDDME
ncbi:hypothetical protein DXG03_007597 [Asterophora parasitica]|uniref:Zn(2)-C6 fungal-type domain-containing protein n=1 Tax=Asterophora parasitica TaxID=117018 RepID=A0A9P7G244_9AGAR|nr:hypothetical protein DXG03_007597 [Asterophora parasitica]